MRYRHIGAQLLFLSLIGLSTGVGLTSRCFAADGKPTQIEIRVRAQIDGRDDLRITPTYAAWTHRTGKWARGVEVNSVKWDPEEHPTLENRRETRYLKSAYQFGKAELKKKGRGQVRLIQDVDHNIQVLFDDPEPGADPYELTITISLQLPAVEVPPAIPPKAVPAGQAAPAVEPAPPAKAAPPKPVPPAEPVPKMKTALVAKLPPEIRRMDPNTGPPGQKIRLTGANLGEVEQVLFAVGESIKEATFRIVSDTELEVTAPEVYRPQPTADALIAVLNARGVCVTCPVTADVVRDSVRSHKASFIHVMEAGSVKEVRNAVTVIESGGIVTSIEDTPWAFVRSEGTLGSMTDVGILFHEPGARIVPLQKGQNNPPNGYRKYRNSMIRTVPQILTANGIGPFEYRWPPPPTNLATEFPPRITKLAPTRVKPGDIVQLSGRGLAGTTTLWITGDRRARKAGFRVISDEQLEFELPLMAPCQFHVTLANQHGATLAAPQQSIWHPGDPTDNLQNQPGIEPVIWVRNGDVLERPIASPAVYFIDQGGTVLKSAGAMYLIRDGGTLLEAWRTQIYHEPNARHPEITNKEPIQQVGEVSLSVIPQVLEVAP